MGIFGSIKDKLFKKNEEAAPVITPMAKSGSTLSGAQSGTAAAAIAAGKAQAAKAEAEAAAKAASSVDVAAILDAAVKAKGIKLNWRESIVDLLKALDLDSSLSARKELAAELKYNGPAADGSAEKNIWLHKEVMKALAENGGKVPAELLK